jgi:lipoprotein-releasing system permease protein
MNLPPAFELFVAARYLKAKRKQTVISIITVISVLGVAAGVMALIIALAVTNGFRNTLQRSLLGATAHVSVVEKQPGPGIANWRELLGKVRALPHVTSTSPTLYGYVYFSGPLQGQGGVIKGLDKGSEAELREVGASLKEGSAQALFAGSGAMSGIILGSKLARSAGMTLSSVVTVISPQGELTPFGPRPGYYRFRVVGIFESGFFDLDNSWAFTTLADAQRVLSLSDVVNSIDIKLDDPGLAPQIARQAEALAGGRLGATHWMEQNRQLLNALKMDKVVTLITIGLIQLVSGLNILIALMMMVMEKHRDIAILISMGARRAQIRNIFVLQGLIIGVIGAVIGLAAGYTLCHFADAQRWISLDEEIYSLSYVPFEARWMDGLWVSAVALGVSLVATIYPARSAARLAPAEALRYE